MTTLTLRMFWRWRGGRLALKLNEFCKMREYCKGWLPALLGRIDTAYRFKANRGMDHSFYMSKAIDLAHRAAAQGEVPVGAIITCGEQVIATTYNLKETMPSGLAHAEVLAIESASKQLGRWRLNDCTLYVTLEPCLMCCGAIISSRVGRVVFGAVDPKAGAVQSLYSTLSDPRLNHRPEVIGGVMAEECGRILKDFFARRRLENSELLTTADISK